MKSRTPPGPGAGIARSVTGFMQQPPAWHCLPESLARYVHGKEGFTSWGMTGQWVHEEFDLSAFSNSDFKVRFYFGSDISYQEAGWYIDDIVFASE